MPPQVSLQIDVKNRIGQVIISDYQLFSCKNA